MIVLLGLVLSAAALSYANGANDVSKGVATLVGSGVTTYRRAILWGTIWTGFGAAAATALTGAMLATFASGLLGAGTTPSFAASLAAIAGAAAWVLLATRTGLPVSTTHAIVGAIVGSAMAAYGMSGIAWDALLARVVFPLAVSPLVAAAVAFGVSQMTRRLPLAQPAAGSSDCLCVSAASPAPAFVAPAGVMVVRTAPDLDMRFTVGNTDSCASSSGTLRLTGDHLHWLSSGAVSFARGLNDAPKIVALTLAAAVLAPTLPTQGGPLLFALVTVAMVTGSLIGGRRITRVLAEDVTPMNHREGLAANVVTAALVTGGAVYGLPMSTTHVASGGIIGIGADRRSLDWRTVRTLALAWIVTLPAAALLGAAAYALVVMRS